MNNIINKLIRLPLKLIPSKAIIPILTGPNRGFLWIKGSGVNSMWLGIYEKEKQSAIKKFTKKGMICYDIGAHAGFYTLLFSRLTGEGGFVYAFEPLQINLIYLQRHLELNRVKNVEVIPCAVSEKEGTGYLNFFDDTFTAKLGDHGKIKVKIISIDKEVNRSKILPPNIIKIDAEGHELAIIKGSKETLKNHKPIIFIALDNINTKIQILDILKQLGYKIYDLKMREIENRNVSQINEIIAKI